MPDSRAYTSGSFIAPFFQASRRWSTNDDDGDELFVSDATGVNPAVISLRMESAVLDPPARWRWLFRSRRRAGDLARVATSFGHAYHKSIIANVNFVRGNSCAAVSFDLWAPSSWTFYSHRWPNDARERERERERDFRRV